MKNILACSILYFVTTLGYADTCPLPSSEYVFRVAAWGDHKSTKDVVRCHYYTPDSKKHIEIRTGGWVDESAFINHPEWSHSDHYHYMCSSYAMDVRDCPFG
jgi:hypothetical protein